ncbi:MAG TPA: RdgB/HAM1 family non-canonical purine NTP pyrophosphatase [Gemmatimonadales bacterium]|nr:RdgB/HAM1 family non-canonical purine NTP pyrophosphatase [Gemmatimonadales bacterium]
MKLCVGTRNPGKAREIRDLFRGLPFVLAFPEDLLLARSAQEEDLEQGATFVENAVAKARHFARVTGLPTVADDSGLEVDALAGAPGPLSARFARMAGRSGPDPDESNNHLLLERLTGVPTERRTARYRCVVAYMDRPQAAPQLVEATCEGRILEAPLGEGGFGYDPLFWSDDLGMTMAQAPLAAKQRVSHRGRAFRALIEMLLRRQGDRLPVGADE